MREDVVKENAVEQLDRYEENQETVMSLKPRERGKESTGTCVEKSKCLKGLVMLRSYGSGRLSQ